MNSGAKATMVFLFLAALSSCREGNFSDRGETPAVPETETSDSTAYKPTPVGEEVAVPEGMELVWNDEFDTDGKPSSHWSFEQGFQRNEELQWYQSDNASVSEGCLVIEGRIENVPNPDYVAGSNDWRTNRSHAEYTSSCLTTSESFSFRYGRVDVRAKIPTASGAWPAIWTLGNMWEWPLNGEIDMMEFYRREGRPIILANACWGSSQPWTAIWDEATVPLSNFTTSDPHWTDKFHVWTMTWDKDFIRLYLDEELINKIDLTETFNEGWMDNYENPFSNNVAGNGQYILLNLAIGSKGDTPDRSAFPLHYYVDYVRVFQTGQ